MNNIEKLAIEHCTRGHGKTVEGDSCYVYTTKQLEAFAKALQSSEPVIKYVGTTEDTNENVHPNDDEPRCDDLIELMRRMGNDTGQGLHPYWKWAMATGFNAAKRIYKNAHPPATVPLEKYNKLLDALKRIGKYPTSREDEKDHRACRQIAAKAIAEAEGKEG